ncbi:ATP-dependent dethiobiotin synthetase BioD [Fulvitalea axinellae]|uniref:ATP-dependent dethiobiotin synthetase BioD n=1 Tax=Fulvitalea axinellae TaxID=1182444 RepID=A0AAU9D553_9BACT|nr:ATP-dependent dethiobiotin synthetase BioD [Fulvitalea axinellae]
MKDNIVFITAIDTDAGKTFATGVLAKQYKDQGINVITQKLSQTGCVGISEDILKHRELMDIPVQEVDKSGLTCPYVFTFPASPHLAAEMDGFEIDPKKITQSTEELSDQYELVLVEGVGGLHVPITRDLSLLDYLEERKYPLILVSSAKLGSVNHTLMSLELAKTRGIEVIGIIYNRHPESPEPIAKDSKRIFADYLKRFGFENAFIADLPIIESGEDLRISNLPLASELV